MERIRLDRLLTERGLARSRSEAQALIHAGDVELDGTRRLKPGQLVAADASVSLVAKPKWASRAGAKLEAALDAFGIDPAGLRQEEGHVVVGAAEIAARPRHVAGDEDSDRAGLHDAGVDAHGAGVEAPHPGRDRRLQLAGHQSGHRHRADG